MMRYDLHLTPTQTLVLANGRTLAFTIQGPADGYPVFYLHGTPGSRCEPIFPDDATLTARLRIITLDRPGYGGSSPCDNYRLLSHAEDILAVAAHLRLHTFSLFGFSGGGIYAMACAAALGPRIQRVVLTASPANALLDDPLSGAGELTRAAWQQAQQDPHALIEQLLPMLDCADTLVNTMLNNMSSADRDLLSSPAILPRYQANLATTLEQGPEQAASAMARDMGSTLQDWGFSPSTLRQPVHIFHGSDDALVDDMHARALASAIPGARLELGKGCGHYAGIYGREAVALWRRVVPGIDG